MSNVTITYDDKEVQVALVDFINRMGNLKPAMEQIGEFSTLQVNRRFDRQVDPDGNQWADLKPETWAKKKSKKILQEQGGSGGLLGSINYRIGQNTFEMGSNKPYAAILQFGGQTQAHIIRPKRAGALAWPGMKTPINPKTGKPNPVKVVHHPGSKFPARPYLGYGEADKQELIYILTEYIANGG